MSKDEIMDEELIGMVSYTDETVPAEMPRMEHDTDPDMPKAECKHMCQEGSGKSKDANWYPIEKQVSLRDRLVGCVKWMGICGGISMLLWWFQINDLMAMQAAYPCILLCGILGGFGVGMHVKRGHRYE